jgi:hypothetical protein
MVELREARKIAARTGLGLQYVLKEYRIFDIWSRISPVLLSNDTTSEVHAICKGGTALNKIFFKGVQRFSEDLDFDAFFAEKQSVSSMIEFLRKNVISILSDSYNLERPRMMRQVVRFPCKYTNEMRRSDQVFCEFNLFAARVGRELVATAKSDIINEIEPVKVRVYSFDTLIAKKLKTFYERAEGKDIYDLYYGLKQTNDKRQLIRALKTVLKAEQIAYDDFVQGFEEQIRDADSIRRVHASTNPYVPRKLRINWQKAAQYIDRIILPKL